VDVSRLPPAGVLICQLHWDTENFHSSVSSVNLLMVLTASKYLQSLMSGSIEGSRICVATFMYAFQILSCAWQESLTLVISVDSSELELK
jgi:hypothetical protein